MEIHHVFFHTFLARARSPDIYNRAQWSRLAPLSRDSRGAPIRLSRQIDAGKKISSQVLILYSRSRSESVTAVHQKTDLKGGLNLFNDDTSNISCI